MSNILTSSLGWSDTLCLAVWLGICYSLIHGVIFSRDFLHPETWQSYGYTDTDPQQFLAEFQDVWPLVLPTPECTRVMELAAGQPLTKVREECNILYEHCETGKALFSSAIKGIAAKLVEEKITAGLTKLQGDVAVEEKAVSSTLASLYEDVAKVAGALTLHGRRPVEMCYRGLRIQVLCADPREQCTLALRLAVRERAVVTSVLKELPGESFLSTTTMATFTVAASAVSKASIARVQLGRLLDAEAADGVSGDTVLVLGGRL